MHYDIYNLDILEVIPVTWFDRLCLTVSHLLITENNAAKILLQRFILFYFILFYISLLPVSAQCCNKYCIFYFSIYCSIYLA